MSTDYGRPECTAVIPADPRVPALPQGELHIGHWSGEIWIDHADPRVVIGVQLLELVEGGGAADGVTLTLAKDAPAGRRFTGAVLRIAATNRTVIYRITECLPWYCGYIAEWPD